MSPVEGSAAPDPRPALVHVPSRDVGAVVVCVAAGSRYEPKSASGLAHLLEHAVFLGAGQRDYRSIRATIDRLGGDVSAETSEELILYWGSANEARDFSECLDLVADLVLAPRLEDEPVKREIGTVVQEISGAGDDVFQSVLESTKQLLWPSHPLGRPVGGAARTLRSLTAEVCRDYWRTTHSPDRLLVLIVGSAAESKQARRRFNARLLDGAIAPPEPPSPPEVQSGGSVRRFRALPMSGRFVRLCFGLPAFGWSDPRIPALSLLNDLLGRDETSHLWEAIRGQGLSYSTESFLDCFSETGWLGILSDAPVDAAGEVVRIVCREVTKVARGLDEEEFEEARRSHVARLRSDEQNAPLEWAKYQAVHAFYRGRVPAVDDLVAEVNQVTFDQARALAAEIFCAGAMHLTAGGPRRALLDAERVFTSMAG